MASTGTAKAGSLDKLLVEVRKTPPSERMHRRNEVAAHGAAALDRLQPWLEDRALASFAIRAIGQIGDADANRTAVLELLRASRPNLQPDHQQDVDEVLARWGERATPARSRAPSTARKVDLTGEMPLELGLRSRLVGAARERRLMSYAEAGEPLELSMRNPSHRPYLAKLLEAINDHEMAAGRPPLSSIVVKKGESSPGAGFFEWGQQHGRVRDGEDEKSYCSREIEETFAYWSKREDPEPYVDESQDAAEGPAGSGTADRELEAATAD